MTEHSTGDDPAGASLSARSVRPSSVKTTEGIDAGRRRFTAAGLATSGLLMTVAARPALGEDSCSAIGGVTLSAWVSGNHSKGHTNTPTCGHSPGYWKKHLTAWPKCYANGYLLTPSARYCDVFKTTVSAASDLMAKANCKYPASYRYPTLADVLDASTYNNVFGRSIICAYLNAYEGASKLLRPTPAEIIAMSKGTFSPSPGAPVWAPEEVVKFLSQTFA